MIRDFKTPDLGKACIRCASDTDSDNFRDRCTDHPDGQHRIVKYEPWVAISFIALYGVRSEATAFRCFYERCGGDGEVARRLTPKEFEAVRTGKARLVIALEPLSANAAAPDPSAQP